MRQLSKPHDVERRTARTVEAEIVARGECDGHFGHEVGKEDKGERAEA